MSPLLILNIFGTASRSILHSKRKSTQMRNIVTDFVVVKSFGFVVEKLGRSAPCQMHSPSHRFVYYSPGNKFERFRGFLELISRFEFEFRRRGNYFF